MVYVNFVSGDLPVVPPSSSQVWEYRAKDGVRWFRIESETPFAAGLRGVVQHLHYTTLDERVSLALRSRAELPAGCTAVLIPIRKSAQWWALAQDQRGAHFHQRHTPIGAPYVERIYRKLYHARYLGSPYDFLTYFEFAPADADHFRQLLAELRATEEWGYVEEEFEVWMTKIR